MLLFLAILAGSRKVYPLPCPPIQPAPLEVEEQAPHQHRPFVGFCRIHETHHWKSSMWYLTLPGHNLDWKYFKICRKPPCLRPFLSQLLNKFIKEPQAVMKLKPGNIMSWDVPPSQTVGNRTQDSHILTKGLCLSSFWTSLSTVAGWGGKISKHGPPLDCGVLMS